MPRIKRLTCEGEGAHDLRPDWLACSECHTPACDFHGDHSTVDEDWLCAACFAAENRRLGVAA